MKKLTIAMVLLMTSMTISAQSLGNTSPQERAEKRMAMLENALPDLTENQKSQINKINAEWVKDVEALQAKYPELKKAREEFKAVNKNKRSKIKEILTPEQRKVLKTEMQKIKGKKRGR